MALDFPPGTDGALFNAPNGVVYRFNASPPPGLWLALASQGNGAVIVSDTAPSNPPTNALWWNSSATPGGGILYLWYQDPTGPPQWVPATPTPSQQSGVLRLYDEQVLSAAGNDLRVSIPTMPKLVQLEFGYQTVSGANDTVILQMLQSGTPLTAGNYDTQRNSAFGSTVQGLLNMSSTGWIISSGVTASGWWKSSWFSSTIGAFPWGTGQIMQSIAASPFREMDTLGHYYSTGITGGLASVTGFRLTPQTVNLIAGSYLRSFVVT